LILVSGNLYSQKLPENQKSGVKAPSYIRVDGILTEFDDKLLNHDPSTDLSYIVANNNKILYFAFRVDDQGIIDRIIGGGICVRIVNNDKKNNSGISFTYPVKSDLSLFSFRRKPATDTLANVAEHLMNSNNARLQNLFKWIKVSGIRALDTISIYNEWAIEAEGKFDAKGNYNVEFAIPITLISSQINNMSKFFYQIKINGGQVPIFRIEPATISANNPDPGASIRFRESLNTIMSKMNAAYNASTDFWGEYTLMQ